MIRSIISSINPSIILFTSGVVLSLSACAGPSFDSLSDPAGSAEVTEGTSSSAPDSASDQENDGESATGEGREQHSAPPSQKEDGGAKPGAERDAGPEKDSSTVLPVGPEDSGPGEGGEHREAGPPKPDKEICGDGIDNDKDGDTDEKGAIGCIDVYWDNDDDGFGGSLAGCFCAGHQPAGATLNHRDCDDNDANVHPGQTNYFSRPRANGSFDYDCDGHETPLINGVGECEVQAWSCTMKQAGWVDEQPNCGEQGHYLTSCTYDNEFDECDEWDTKKTQMCN